MKTKPNIIFFLTIKIQSNHVSVICKTILFYFYFFQTIMQVVWINNFRDIYKKKIFIFVWKIIIKKIDINFIKYKKEQLKYLLIYSVIFQFTYLFFFN